MATPDGSPLRLSNGHLEIAVTTAYGPRVIHAAVPGSDNVMAELPDATLEWRDGRFSLRGGHRLWVAPEVRDLTYTPDDDPVELHEVENGVIVGTPPSDSSPFHREMEIILGVGKPRLTITHRLTYTGSSTAVAAPWAITMLPADGTVVLPMRRGAPDQLQADRNVVLWPYTSLHDPLIDISDEAIFVHGGRSEPTKIGTSGVAGWSAYLRGNTALIKRAVADASATYPDKGAGLQCFANSYFMELETLGPLATLNPGETVEHLETWEVRSVEASATPATELLAKLRALTGA